MFISSFFRCLFFFFFFQAEDGIRDLIVTGVQTCALPIYFRSVALILRETRAILQRARELIPEHRTTLEGLPARLSQHDALSQLLQSLDEEIGRASCRERV